MSTYMRLPPAGLPTSDRSGTRRVRRRRHAIAALFLAIPLAGACDGAGRPPNPADDPAGGGASAAGAEAVSTLRAAPFQSSAITLVGTAGGKARAWTFERFTADLRLRGATPVGLDVKIQTAFTATSDASLKARLLGADVLTQATHPEATFHAISFNESSRAGDAVTYAATGSLALAGRAHATTIPFELSRTTDGWVARVVSSVDRAGWQTAFAGAPDGVFDDRLQVQARLVFPAAGRR